MRSPRQERRRIRCVHPRRMLPPSDVRQQRLVCAGYSRTFGRKEGCNKRSAGMISTALGYKVSWSDDGY